ncbi:alpha/beta hydrolase [Corynebacterium sp. 335C]
MTDGFTPITTDDQRLRQLVDYLEEHVTAFAPGAVAGLPPRPADGASAAELSAWRDDVAAARAEANRTVARQDDAVVHAAMLVLGAGLNHTLPFTAYGRPGTSWRGVSISVPAEPSWAVPALRRADGGEDDLPVAAPPAGVEPVPAVAATVYVPEQPTGAAVVAAHGGGWWMGDGDVRDTCFGPDCAALAERSGAVVVDVDYRLAPEHPLPAAVADLTAAVDWVRANADELGVDPSSIVLWGVSSGGHAAALAALTGADVASVALTMPALDLRGDDRAAALAELMFGAPADPASAAASPVVADVSALRRVHVQTASHDDVARGGAEFADAVRAAGGEATTAEFLATHMVTAPAERRRRITDLARHVIDVAGVPREVPEDPAGEYDKEAVDRANEESWGRGR